MSTDTYTYITLNWTAGEFPGTWKFCSTDGRMFGFVCVEDDGVVYGDSARAGYSRPFATIYEAAAVIEADVRACPWPL